MNIRHQRSSSLRAPVAPLHRGPQAAAHAAAGIATPHAAPNAALLIDFDNVTMGIRSDLQTELRNLLSSDIISGKVAVQRAYADWRRYPQYIVPLSESSIDLIFAPAYGSSKKNATDIRLAVDAVELVFTRPEIGTYILLSGDSDFSSLVLKLKEYGKYVIGVGIRESSSDLLVQNCDEYYSYNALAGLVKSSDETAAQKWDPWELVTEAITRMSKNGDVMRSDRLKQVMQEIDPTFDEKNLGMSKFSRFCQEASHKGLILVTKLENGQLEVALPSAPRKDAPKAAEAAAVAAAPRDDEEGRGRRGRRGGRGRGRERGAEPRPEAAGAPAVVSAPAAAPAAAPAPAPAAPAPHHPRHERKHAAPQVDATIGVSGVRLTRDEAFSLVRRAVEALTTGDASVMAEAVRVKSRELLGRDSESLSDRNFTRILRDTHDAGAVDVRRRGDSFEVSRVEGAVSVADQLSAAEAQAKADAPPAPVAAPAPRGVGASRGLPAKGGRGAKVPPSLLLLGVVDDTPAVTPPSEPAAAEPAKKGRPGRKPSAKAGAAAKADAPAKAESPAKAAAKAKPAARKPRAKKGPAA
ncbi:MAG: NYN domain-containing protein [Gemmatimonadetes bacterium]|nr:NYN domain-containing protein [Gemmatimonadota bacterium]